MENSNTTGKKTWKSRYTVLSFIWLAWMLSYLDRMVMNFSLPFIGKDLGLDKADQGLIISAFFIGYALFQVPGGYLADRFGPRFSMAIAILWWSIFTSLTGVATSLGVLLFVRVLFGIGEGAFPAGSWKSISTYFPSKERGRATAIQTSVGTLGPALASIVGAGFIAAIGWRDVFLYLGIPGFFVAWGIFHYCRNQPKDSPGITEEELNELAEDITQTASLQTAEKPSMMELFKSPVIWQLAIVWFLFNVTFWGFSTWLPSYLMEARGLSLKQTGVYGAIPFLCGTVGGLLGGYFSDKYKNGRTLMYAFTACGGALLLYMTFISENLTLAIVYQSIAMACMFFAVGLFWGILMDTITPEVMGTASGMVNVGAQFAGIIAAPVMGFLIDKSGGLYFTAFLFIIIALALSAVVVLTIGKPKVTS